MSRLECRLIATAHDDAVTLAFALSNPGADEVVLTRSDPFVDFQLRVRAAGEEVLPAVAPSSYQLQLVEERIASGEEVVISTPVTLRFDPDLVEAQLPAFVWGLALPPQPLELEARLSLGDLTPEVCSAVVEPQPPV
jgi:hypothetical protein